MVPGKYLGAASSATNEYGFNLAISSLKLEKNNKIYDCILLIRYILAFLRHSYNFTTKVYCDAYTCLCHTEVLWTSILKYIS